MNGRKHNFFHCEIRCSECSARQKCAVMPRFRGRMRFIDFEQAVRHIASSHSVSPLPHVIPEQPFALGVTSGAFRTCCPSSHSPGRTSLSSHCVSGSARSGAGRETADGRAGAPPQASGGSRPGQSTDQSRGCQENMRNKKLKISVAF